MNTTEPAPAKPRLTRRRVIAGGILLVLVLAHVFWPFRIRASLR